MSKPPVKIAKISASLIDPSKRLMNIVSLGTVKYSCIGSSE
jgi:hypothetical protein